MNRDFLILFFILSASLLNGVGIEDEVLDPEIVEILVSGVTNDQLVAAHCKYPRRGIYKKRLNKSGERIFSEPDVLKNLPLFKVLDVTSRIKGECYDYLFLTYGRFHSRNHYRFLEGGDYILFLEPSMDGNNNIITDQIEPALYDGIRKLSFLSHDTLFDIHHVNGRASVIGFSIVDGKRDPMHVPDEGVKLVGDLSLISEFLHNGGHDIELPSLFDHLKSKYGVQVAIEIFGAPEDLSVSQAAEEPVDVINSPIDEISTGFSKVEGAAQPEASNEKPSDAEKLEAFRARKDTILNSLENRYESISPEKKKLMREISDYNFGKSGEIPLVEGILKPDADPLEQLYPIREIRLDDHTLPMIINLLEVSPEDSIKSKIVWRLRDEILTGKLELSPEIESLLKSYADGGEYFDSELRRASALTLGQAHELQEKKITLLGFVENPGEYTLSPGQNLFELILLSEGPEQYAGGPTIKRTTENGRQQMIQIDLPKIISERKNFELNAGDTIYFDSGGPLGGWILSPKKLLNQIREALEPINP